ncbi:MAG: hypothetical protein AABX30_02630 [Nanoarchaeota archaeon]
MTIQILNQRRKQEVIKNLNQQFGVKEIQGNLIKTGKEKIFLYTGTLSEKELLEISNRIHLEGIGLYIAKEQEENIRLTIEGAILLKDQIIKNIFEINREQLKEWMRGSEILLDEDDNSIMKGGESGRVGGMINQQKPKGFVVMSYKGDFLGCGKASEKKITNFIPKGRRLKTQ